MYIRVPLGIHTAAFTVHAIHFNAVEHHFDSTCNWFSQSHSPKACDQMNMWTYVILSFVNVSMCPCTTWPVSPRYNWAKYCNVDHLAQSGWFKLKHFCRLSGKHDAIESLLQTLKECKTNQKHIRICIMSNGFSTDFESSKSVPYHDIANRRCSLTCLPKAQFQFLR